MKCHIQLHYFRLLYIKCVCVCAYVYDVQLSVLKLIYVHIIDITLLILIYKLYKTVLFNILKVYSNIDDYLGIGVYEGRLKVITSLGWWSEAEIVSDTEVSDKRWHHVVIHR